MRFACASHLHAQLQADLGSCKPYSLDSRVSHQALHLERPVWLAPTSPAAYCC